MEAKIQLLYIYIYIHIHIYVYIYLSRAIVLWLFSSLSQSLQATQAVGFGGLFFSHVFLEESFKELTFVVTQIQAVIIFAAERKEVLF